MSVLEVATRMNVGGPARLLLDLVQGLDAEFDVALAAGIAPPHEGELGDPAVKVLRVPLVRELRPFVDIHAVLRLRSLIKRHGATVVHTHMAKAGVAGRVAALSVRPRPRTVHTFHGHVLNGYFSPGRQRLFLEIERALAPLTTVLVAVSEGQRNELLSLGIGSPSQYRVIPIGVDLQRFARPSPESGRIRRELGISARVTLIGMVGRLTAIKDNRTALEALLLMPDAHLVLIGDGELRAFLENDARAMGLAERVHFVGWYADVPGALRDLDVVVMTSLNEGTPLALVEALAAGTPVVATRVGGIPDVVRDGETGILVEPKRPDQLAEAVQRLLGDGDLRESMIVRGRRAVAQRHSREACVRAHAELYREIETRRARAGIRGMSAH